MSLGATRVDFSCFDLFFSSEGKIANDEEMYKNLSAEASQFLGGTSLLFEGAQDIASYLSVAFRCAGDIEHTHLVKGLDRALLNKHRQMDTAEDAALERSAFAALRRSTCLLFDD